MNLKQPLILLAALVAGGWPTVADAQVGGEIRSVRPEVVVFRELPSGMDPLRVSPPRFDADQLEAWCQSKTNSILEQAKPRHGDRRSILIIPGETEPRGEDLENWRIAIARAPQLFPSSGELPMQPILPGTKQDLRDRLIDFTVKHGSTAKTRYPLESPSEGHVEIPAESVRR